MPWTAAQMRAIGRRAGGAKTGPFSNVSEDKAKEMLSEGTKPVASGQHRALRVMLRRKVSRR